MKRRGPVDPQTAGGARGDSATLTRLINPTGTPQECLNTLEEDSDAP